MPIITLRTRIKAPVERVFALSRSLVFYRERIADSEEKLVSEPSVDRLDLGVETIWEGSALKFRQGLHLKVIELNAPESLVEEMVSGPFLHMKHSRSLSSDKGATLLVDEFDYKSAHGPLAWFSENSFLTAFIRRNLADRNRILKEVAESSDWEPYLTEPSS